MDQATASKAENGVVRSADGTAIGYVKLGVGLPLVIAHGALCTHEDWMAVARELARGFTCYVMDRRGRGASGDNTRAAYAVDREIEDIQAVLAAAGPGACLIGHSYGAFCSLLTALRTPVPRLVLYEPPWPIKGAIHARATAEGPSLIAQGRSEDAFWVFMGDSMQISRPPLLFLFRALPASLQARLMPSYVRMIGLMPITIREMVAVDRAGPGLERFADLKMPVLLLLGSQSHQPHIRDVTLALAKIVPNAKLVELKGQGHVAQAQAPKLVASEIAAFLSPNAEVA